MKNLKTNERGFTLVEAMVAMVIVTIGLVSLAELLAISLRLQQLGRNQATAARMASDLIDELRSLNFDAEPRIQIGGDLDTDVESYNDHPTDDSGNLLGYRRRWVVAAGPDSAAGPEPNIRLITVRVIPDVSDSRTASSYELVTIIHRW